MASSVGSTYNDTLRVGQNNRGETEVIMNETNEEGSPNSLDLSSMATRLLEHLCIRGILTPFGERCGVGAPSNQHVSVLWPPG